MSGATTLRAGWEPRILSVLRIVAGVQFLQHGLNKLLDFPPTATHAPYHLFSLVPGLAALLETFGSLLLIVGLFTRPVAFLLSGEMALAYFMVHAHRGFYPMLNGGDLAILFCFVFFYLFVAGGGAWSLDRFSRGRA